MNRGGRAHGELPDMLMETGGGWRAGMHYGPFEIKRSG